MAAFNAAQWQATASKNQLVLGPNGKQAVISAEDFGQISTINIPDPGQARAEFVLTSSASGTQTINGNLIVTGTFTNPSASNNEVVDGDLILTNTANRAIRHGTGPVPVTRTLSIIGSESEASQAGGTLIVQGGKATQGSAVGGKVEIVGGLGFSGGAGGPVEITGASGVSSVSNGGSVKITGGTAGENKTGGFINIITGNGGENNGISGNLLMQTGNGGLNPTTQGASGSIAIKTGDSFLPGSGSGSIAISTGSGISQSGNLTIDVGPAIGEGQILIGQSVPANGIQIGNILQTGIGVNIFAHIKLVTTVASSPMTLTDGHSGSLVKISATGAVTVNLPSLNPGLFFKFVTVARGGTGAATIICPDGAKIFGALNYSNGTGQPVSANTNTGATGQTTVTFSTNALLGDWIELNCDDTTWYATGQSRVTNGITIP